MAQNAVTVGSGVTNYFPVATANLNGNATKANRDCTFRTAGTISNFIVRKQAGDRTGMTAAVMVGAGAGNSAIAFTSTNGEYEDVTNTDVITAGQTGIAYQIVGGTGGTTSFTTPRIGCQWEVAGDTVNRLAHSASLTINSASRTSYKWLGTSDTTTQAQGEWLVKLPTGVDHVTLRNLYVYVSACTWSSDILISINGASGPGTAPNVATHAVGVIEDTSNSIQARDGDLISFKIVTPSGANSIIIETIVIEVQCDRGCYHIMLCSTGGTAPGTGNWSPPGGTFGAVATEANAQMKLGTAALISLLSANILTGAASSTITLRANAASKTPSVSGAATGWVTDAVNTYTAAAGDELTYLTAVANPTINTVVITLQAIPGGVPAQRRRNPLLNR